MGRYPLVLAATALIVLAVPAISFAAMPNPRSDVVKVPKSIGGIDIGTNFNEAKDQWGKGGACTKSGSFANCTYHSKKSADGNAGFASDGGKITSVSINAGVNEKGKYELGGPLSKFETKDGFGIGDKGSKFAHAYPKAKKDGTSGYIVNGRGKTYMYLGTSDGKHITGLFLSDGNGG